MFEAMSETPSRNRRSAGFSRVWEIEAGREAEIIPGVFEN
jgi:hypothetical protein